MDINNKIEALGLLQFTLIGLKASGGLAITWWWALAPILALVLVTTVALIYILSIISARD